MENLLAVYSVIIIFVNTMCDVILSKLKNTQPLDGPSMVPPIGIIALIIYVLKRKKIKEDKWRVSITDITDGEYAYIMDKATPEELEIIFSPPKNKADRKKIDKIITKYCSLHIKDYFHDINEAFLNN